MQEAGSLSGRFRTLRRLKTDSVVAGRVRGPTKKMHAKCLCIYTYIHTGYLRIYIYTYTYILIRIHTYIHTYVHTYVPTYLHTCILTYIHTYIHVYTQGTLRVGNLAT